MGFACLLWSVCSYSSFEIQMHEQRYKVHLQLVNKLFELVMEAKSKQSQFKEKALANCL